MLTLDLTAKEIDFFSLNIHIPNDCYNRMNKIKIS